MYVKLRPSKAATWMKCAGSAQMQAPFLTLQQTGQAAEEGTAAHWVASQLTTGSSVELGASAPNGIEVDSDMLMYAEEYVTILQSWGSDLIVEKTMSVSVIENEGTPDVYAIDTLNKLLRICDYKYGRTAVEVDPNWQLLCYVHELVRVHNLHDYEIELSIFQPRARHGDGPYRARIYTLSELLPLFEQLQEGARLALSDNPPLKTGSQCTYCEARHVCDALDQAACVAVEISQEISSTELTMSQAGQELIRLEDAMEIIKARKSGLEAHIEHGLLKGELSPHFSIGRVKKHQVWKEGSDANIIEIGKLLGKDFSTPVKALSPAQCRKLKLDEDIIQAHSVIPLGETKLVRNNLNETKKLFGK